MGKHYLPQRYLRNFECPGCPGSVWQYDKKTGEVRQVAIKTAAQTADYFPEDLERLLAHAVEGPANPAMAKLIAGQAITDSERHDMALYVATMLMRVPGNRRRMLEVYPIQLADYCARLRHDIKALEGTLPEATPERVAAVLGYLDDFESRAARDPGLAMLEEMMTPVPFTAMVQAIEGMTWRVMLAPESDRFVTGDNPAFIFRWWGLGSRESELSFPLSPTRALHGSWQKGPSLLMFVPASSTFVKEVNRRVVSITERFAFAHETMRWLPVVLRKESLSLNQLGWSNEPNWYAPPSIEPTGRRYFVRAGDERTNPASASEPEPSR
jgi:hypothetical protein